MNYINKYAWLFLFLISIMVAGCSDDEVTCTEASLSEELSAQLGDYTEVYFEYLADKSTANCQALIESSESYVQFYKDNRDCIEKLAGDQLDVDEEIDELELGLESLDC